MSFLPNTCKDFFFFFENHHSQTEAPSLLLHNINYQSNGFMTYSIN